MNIDIGFNEQTILIIDDNPTNLGVIADYLEECNFEVITARHGEEGLQKAEYVQPDLILLDVMMPGIDGFETCRRLKAEAATTDIPVIFMTALASEEDKVRGFEAGAVDYVIKPVQQREVLARINTHLRIREQSQQLKEQNELLEVATDELEKSNDALAKLATQLEVGSQIGQQLISILDLNDVADTVVKAIQIKFGYYFVSIWLLSSREEVLTLAACAGQVESFGMVKETVLSIHLEDSIIVTAYRTGQQYLANDVSSDPYYLAFENLPATQSELAFPLRVGPETIGVLDIQSDQVAAFDLDDRTVLQMLANQIAIAINNARLYSELAKLNADKDKFFSIVAHDLKGPFLPLLGNAELLSEMAFGLSQQDVKDMSGSIHRSAKRVFDLLENLLQWSRIQMGRMEYEPELLDLAKIIQQNINLLQENALHKEIKLQSQVDETIWVYADDNMLHTIIRNLTNNALKFTPSGGEVNILACPDGEYVQVSVQDTGVGISSEDVDKLFKIEVHHSTSGTAKERGTGLGLIMCKEMVEMNRGHIWVESQLGQGTMVNFTVPKSTR